MKRLLPAALLSALLITSSFAALSGPEIMKKNEEARKIDDYTVQASLTTQKPGEGERKKKFRLWRKIREDRVRYRTLTLFSEPGEIKGQAILFLENEAGANDISLYLPAYKKVRRVESGQQSGSFMGSDLSYSDITEKHVEDYEYALLKEDACAAAAKCFVVEGKPKSDDVRARIGYSKFQTWIDPATFMAVRAEYWDLAGAPVKKIVTSETKPVAGTAHFFSYKIEVEQLKTGSKTSLVFDSLKLPSGANDAFFNAANLSKAKE